MAKQKTEKTEKAERMKSSPEELAQKHVSDTAYCVQRMDEWASKLIAKVNSRKYHLTTEQTDKVISAVNDISARVASEVRPSEETQKPKFVL